MRCSADDMGRRARRDVIRRVVGDFLLERRILNYYDGVAGEGQWLRRIASKLVLSGTVRLRERRRQCDSCLLTSVVQYPGRESLCASGWMLSERREAVDDA